LFSDLTAGVRRLTLAVLLSAVALGLGPTIARAVQNELERQKSAAD